MLQEHPPVQVLRGFVDGMEMVAEAVCEGVRYALCAYELIGRVSDFLSMSSLHHLLALNSLFYSAPKTIRICYSKLNEQKIYPGTMYRGHEELPCHIPTGISICMGSTWQASPSNSRPLDPRRCITSGKILEF